MSRFLLSAVVGAAAALAFVGASPAAEPDANGRVVVVVKATDAELHTPDGARALALRVRNAAARACGGDLYPVAVRISTGFIECREAAIDRAIKDIDAPMLSVALGHPPQVLARSGR